MELFQRQITTSAYKIAGGVDLSSVKASQRQSPIPQAFVSKITKGFLDAMYAFLDGEIKLAGEDEGNKMGRKAPPTTDTSMMTTKGGRSTASGSNPLELLDLSDTVRSLVVLGHRRMLLTESITGCPTVARYIQFGAAVAEHCSLHDHAVGECIW